MGEQVEEYLSIYSGQGRDGRVACLGQDFPHSFYAGRKSFTGKDFERFADAHPMGIKRQLNAFVVKSILDYENNRLEQKYPDFRLALQQRRDDLLLAAITRRESRQVSLSDSVALKAFLRNTGPITIGIRPVTGVPYCMEPIKRL